VARLVAKQQTGIAPLGRYITAHGSSIAAYLTRHGPFLARLVFSNEKSCLYPLYSLNPSTDQKQTVYHWTISRYFKITIIDLLQTPTTSSPYSSRSITCPWIFETLYNLGILCYM